MIEILNIVIQNIVFIFLSCCGVYSLLTFKNKKINISYEIIISILLNNFLFSLLLIWFCFLFNFNKEYFFILIIIFNFFCIFFCLHKKNIFNKKNIIIISLIFTLCFVLSVDVAYNLFTSHDARKFHIINATIYYENFFVKDITYKNEYPQFGNYLWAFFWKNSLVKIEYLGRLSYIYIYIISLIYLFSALKIDYFYKILLTLIVLVLSYKENYFDGRTDILVFSILSIITKNLYDFFYYKEYNKLNSFEFLISLNLLVWIKSECLLYVVSIYLAIIFFFKGNQNTKFFFSFYFLLIILTRFFFIFYYNLPFNPNVETFDKNIIPVSNIYDILYRSSLIFFWYLANLLKNPLMIINFLCFYFLIFNIKVKIKEFYFLIFIFFLNSIAIYLTFLFTKYSFPFHLIGSLDRIIYQTSSLFLIPTFYLINKYFKKI
jgi:hypothetical protein